MTPAENMTPGPEMDAAVARALGWKHVESGAWGVSGLAPGCDWKRDDYRPIQPYSTDIAAAHAMEDEIERRGLADNYAAHLCDVINSDLGRCHASVRSMFWPLAHATPEQRCRAALLALAAAGK